MTASQFAKKSGFSGARKIAPRHGYVCHEALYNANDSLNDVPVIGYPQIIFERGGQFRFADIDEVMRYMQEVTNNG